MILRSHLITFINFQQQQQHGSNVVRSQPATTNGKHEVDLPDTKATTGLHMDIKHISEKIVRASCILSVKLLKQRHHLWTAEL